MGITRRGFVVPLPAAAAILSAVLPTWAEVRWIYPPAA